MLDRSWKFVRLISLLALIITLTCYGGMQSAPAQAGRLASAQSGTLPPGVEKVSSVEGFTEYRLPNGLRVLLFPEPTKPTITVNMTYEVGSASENYGETGMAHLLEHLMFKGSPKHTNIAQELTEHGARPNGTTPPIVRIISKRFRPTIQIWTGRSISNRTAWSTRLLRKKISIAK